VKKVKKDIGITQASPIHKLVGCVTYEELLDLNRTGDG